jgi:hypothetical protein
MSLALAAEPDNYHDIIENIVTEDDEPVDNLYSEKQRRFLTRSLIVRGRHRRMKTAPEKSASFSLQPMLASSLP